MRNVVATVLILAALAVMPAVQASDAYLADNPDSIMDHFGKSKVFPAGPTWSYRTIGESVLILGETPMPEGAALVSNPDSIMRHFGRSKVFPAGPVWAFDTIGCSKVVFS